MCERRCACCLRSASVEIDGWVRNLEAWTETEHFATSDLAGSIRVHSGQGWEISKQWLSATCLRPPVRLCAEAV